MLSSQRQLFDIPSEVCYLNAAAWSPLPLATMEAGRKAVGRKGQPWLIDQAFASEQYERARRAAARLIKASPDDMALIPSIAYGVNRGEGAAGAARIARPRDRGRPFLAGAGMAHALGGGRLHGGDGRAGPATVIGQKRC